MKITFTLNGDSVVTSIEGSELLMDVVRDALGQTGTKEGCGKGECGACTVMIDDRPVNACLYPAIEAEGRKVVTIEGLGGRTKPLNHVQAAFVEQGGVQCGFCTPGMIMNSTALLERDPDPSDDDIRHALTGNICRCTGYAQILESVHRAAELKREGDGASPAADDGGAE